MRKTKIKKNDGFVGEKMIIIPKSITEKYFFNPFVERLYLTDVGYFPNAECHFVERKEGVPEWIFFYCISGEGIIRLGEKSFSLSAKTALCIPPNVPHTYFADKDNPWSILWIHFNGKDVNLFPLQQVELIKFQATHSSNTMLFYFDQLFNAAEDYNEKNIIHISHIIQIILSETYYKSCILKKCPTKWLDTSIKM